MPMIAIIANRPLASAHESRGGGDSSPRETCPINMHEYGLYTPPKFKFIDPDNDTFPNKSPFPGGHFLVPCQTSGV